jgi:Transposase IS116/IS110/IS902 family
MILHIYTIIHTLISFVAIFTGLIVLFGMLAGEIDSVERFSCAAKLCAYAGLVPRTYASGGKDARTGPAHLPQDFAKFFSSRCHVILCEFRPRVCPIFSKAAAMSAVRFLKGRRPHLPSRLHARQSPASNQRPSFGCQFNPALN